MFFDQKEFLWAIGGLLFVLLEFLLPGTFVMFLGIGGIMTGIVTRIFQPELSVQLLVFVLSTFFSVALGGPLIRKLFRPTVTVDPLVNDDYLHKIVSVEEEILVRQKGGKVLFQGTVWDAISLSEKIPKGKSAKIVARDNLTFSVEPVVIEDSQK